MNPLRIASQLQTAAAAVWASYSTSPRPAKARLLCLLSVFLWLGANSLHDGLWSYRYWKVDPWSHKAPVQWPVVGTHARTHSALAEELQGCLPDGAEVALLPAEPWRPAGLYLAMWLAYSFPEQDIVRLETPELPPFADLLLHYHGQDSPGSAVVSPIPGTELVCRARYMDIFGRVDGDLAAR